MIISGIPVDCAETRKFVREIFGADPAKLPWLNPYPGSVKGKCQAHGGPIWIGPQQQKALQTGMADTTICHFCAVVISDGDIDLMSLSDKTTTEY